jgi:hypothetical protein
LNASRKIKNAALILTTAAIGYAGFTTVPRIAALVLAVPVLWALADSRYTAFAVILAYKLAASRGLLPGAAVFLSENHTFAQAAALYFILPFGASLPFLIFWDGERQQKAMGIVAAFFIAYVLPPMSLIGIINPLIASGAIFRGWGFAGMGAMLGVYAACSFSRKTAYAVLCVIAAFTVLAPNHWYEPPEAKGIMAVKLWGDEIQKSLPGKTVIFGAELPTGDGKKYDNAAVMLYEGKIAYTRQRI